MDDHDVDGKAKVDWAGDENTIDYGPLNLLTVKARVGVDAQGGAGQHRVVGTQRWRVLAAENLNRHFVVVLSIVETLNIQQDRHRPVLDRTGNHSVDELPLVKPAEHVLPIFAKVGIVDDGEETVIDAGFLVGPNEVVVGALTRRRRITARNAVIEIETVEAGLGIGGIVKAERGRDETEPREHESTTCLARSTRATTSSGSDRALTSTASEHG
ncbi:MAG: hypothetical protein JRJ24_21885 [Deltaproteobacteria bacterium]|nr:hypothetical protein [Deltaproteobacteria bacterium]